MRRAAWEAGLGWVWRASTRGAAAAGLALAPLETAFVATVAVRNRRYDAGRAPVRSAAVPVVSVGNLSVGGSGKTPLAAWLAAWFLQRRVRPGIVTNGYGPDEVLLHRCWNPGIPVAAGRRRARAAAAAVEQGAQVVILDDGFQHRALARDLDLVLVAAEHPTPVRLLPRGPYREPERALRRADGVIVTRRSASFVDAHKRAASLAAAHGLHFALVRLKAGRWRDLQGAGIPVPEGSVLAVSGIATPRVFHELLEREFSGMETESMTFGDHHDYSARDVVAIARRARGRPVVTTAKDSVKLGGLVDLGVDVRVLHLEVVVEEGRRWLERALERLPGVFGKMTAAGAPTGSVAADGDGAGRGGGADPEESGVHGGRTPSQPAGGTPW